MAKSATASRESKSPKQPRKTSPSRAGTADTKQDKSQAKGDSTNVAEGSKPLAPPKQANGNSKNSEVPNPGSLNLEPNPFEQSFGAPPDTPGGTKLPPVAALTSPSSLLPGGGTTPFNWGGGSLRTGPLSPAMLSGPATDYFSDTHHLRGGFPTPNESSLRTGLTPGGSGSMFPAPSPNSQALFASLQSGGATPSTLDFHRTAMNAAAAKRDSQSQVPPAQLSQENANANIKAEPKPSGPFDPHDNDAANGLFMLAQGRNGAQQPGNQFNATSQPQGQAAAPMDTSPQMNGRASIGSGSVRGVSETASAASDDSQHVRPNTRAKGKKGASHNGNANGRRKADEPAAKGPAAKKAKTNGATAAPVMNGMHSEEPSEDDEDDDEKGGLDGGPRSKMTDEEKRKNFLERNRVAALKCRQRKKQWLANLQTKVEMFSSENDALTAQISQLREEVVNLKTLLLAHKDCPVTQQQGIHGAFMQQAMEPYNSQMNPYGMAGPMPGPQPVMAGNVGQRRYS